MPYSQVEDFVPVWVQSPFNHSGRFRLLATQRRNCKRVRKSYVTRLERLSSWGNGIRTENITLVQAVGSNYC